MFHRIIVSNYIYSFDKKKYEHVISKIIKGKIYTHYIDTKRDIGIENQLYYKYLSYKNHIYLKKNYDGNKTKQNCIILKNDDNINEDEINRIISKIKVDSDYSLVKEIEDKDTVSKQVGIGAVIFEDLSESRIKNQVFDLSKALNFNGETGPYIQYIYVRTKSVIEKAGYLPKFEDININIEDKFQNLKIYGNIKYSDSKNPRLQGVAFG